MTTTACAGAPTGNCPPAGCRQSPCSCRGCPVIDDTCRPWAHQLELLQTIPGVGPKVAQITIAETGGDMRQFPTASHLVAWAGLAPGLHESAGRRRPSGVR